MGGAWLLLRQMGGAWNLLRLPSPLPHLPLFSYMKLLSSTIHTQPNIKNTTSSSSSSSCTSGPHDTWPEYSAQGNDKCLTSASASALLAFATSNPQLLGRLSRRDIEVVVTNGTPFLFRDALQTAQRMTAFLGGGGVGNTIQADTANTVDLMKYVLSYASNPAIHSLQTNIYSRELVESSVRNLLQELAVLNSGTPSLDQLVKEQTQFQDRYAQTSRLPKTNIVTKRGNFICPKCCFINFERNYQCLECEEHKPKKVLAVGEWECPQCNFSNNGRNTLCLRCDCNMPGPLPSNPVNSMSASGYSGDYQYHSSIDCRPSQDVINSNISSTTNEYFPEIMPLRSGENRFIVSTRKTPLERCQTSISKGRASGPVGVGKSNVDYLVNQSQDKFLGCSSANFQNGNKGITSDQNPEAAFPIPQGASEVSSISNSGDGNQFQISHTSKNVNSVNNKNKEQEDKSGRRLQTIDELHNIIDVLSAVIKEGFLNDLIVSKKKTSSLTSSASSMNAASEQDSSSKYGPYVAFPPGFAKTEPQPPEGSFSPVDSADNVPTSPQLTQRYAVTNNSRISQYGAGAINSMENDQISSESNIISAHQEISSDRHDSHTSQLQNAAQSLLKTDLLKDACQLPDHTRDPYGEDSVAQNIAHSTNVTGDSPHSPPNHNMQSDCTGKSNLGPLMNTGGPDPPYKVTSGLQLPGKDEFESSRATSTVMNPTFAALIRQHNCPQSQGNSSSEPYQRMNLTFRTPNRVDGKPLVELPQSVVMAGEEKWKYSVIGYVLGYSPSFCEMECYVRLRWAEFGSVKVHRMGAGIYVYQMESDMAQLAVLEKGPWSFSSRPLILRMWEVGMALDKPAVNSLPIWVQFPRLPLDLRTEEGLSLISSQIGKPLFAERETTEQFRMDHPRVCVEIDTESELFDEIPVKYYNGRTYNQEVIYEWLPNKCIKCNLFGHKDENCTAVLEYRPKAVDDVPVHEGPTVLAWPVQGGEAAKNKGKEIVEGVEKCVTEIVRADSSRAPPIKMDVQNSFEVLAGQTEVSTKEGVITPVNSPIPGIFDRHVSERKSENTARDFLDYDNVVGEMLKMFNTAAPRIVAGSNVQPQEKQRKGGKKGRMKVGKHTSAKRS